MWQIGFWLKQNFILPDRFSVEEASVELWGVVLHTKTSVGFSYSADGWLLLQSQRLDVCADIIQQLASFLNIQQLASEIEIDSEELEQLMALLHNIRELQSVRQRLTIDTAEQVNSLIHWILFILISLKKVFPKEKII